MKPCAAWFGFSAMTAVNYFETAAALGLDAVEVPLYWQVVKDRDAGWDYRRSDQVRRLSRQASDAGVRLVAAVGNATLARRGVHPHGEVTASEVAFSEAVARRAIDLAADLGLEVYRVSEPSLTASETSIYREVLDEWVAPLCRLGEYAEGKGLRVCVENYGMTVNAMSYLMARVNEDAPVGTLFDPCNYYRMGEDPAAAWQALAPWVAYVHLKDSLKRPAVDGPSLFRESRWGPSCALGEGDMDWGELLPMIRAGYSGYVALEYELFTDVVRGTRVGLAFLRRRQAVP